MNRGTGSESGGKARPSLAIVGGGIAGLGVARELQGDFDITLFEAQPRLGGNIRPVRFVDLQGCARELDTGFLAYQPAHYPHISALLEALDIVTTEMPLSSSLEVRDAVGALLYHPGDFMRPGGSGGDPDLAHHGRRLIRLFISLEENPMLLGGVHTRIGQYLDDQGYHPLILERFIIPIMAVIWGFQEHQVRAMAAECALGELCRLISPARRLVPSTALYLHALINGLPGVRLLVNHPVSRVKEVNNGVSLDCKDRTWEFDYAVLTTCPEQTLDLVDTLPERVSHCLKNMNYYQSIAVVHTAGKLATYHQQQNRLFTLRYLNDAAGEWITTWDLNTDTDRTAPDRPVVSFGNRHLDWNQLLQGAHIYKTFTNHHPALTPAFREAQKELNRLNNGPRLYLAGSFLGRLGNHENAYVSALQVANKIRRHCAEHF